MAGERGAACAVVLANVYILPPRHSHPPGHPGGPKEEEEGEKRNMGNKPLLHVLRVLIALPTSYTRQESKSLALLGQTMEVRSRLAIPQITFGLVLFGQWMHARSN